MGSPLRLYAFAKDTIMGDFLILKGIINKILSIVGSSLIRIVKLQMPFKCIPTIPELWPLSHSFGGSPPRLLTDFEQHFEIYDFMDSMICGKSNVVAIQVHLKLK